MIISPFALSCFLLPSAEKSEGRSREPAWAKPESKRLPCFFFVLAAAASALVGCGPMVVFLLVSQWIPSNGTSRVSFPF